LDFNRKLKDVTDTKKRKKEKKIKKYDESVFRNYILHIYTLKKAVARNAMNQ